MELLLLSHAYRVNWCWGYRHNAVRLELGVAFGVGGWAATEHWYLAKDTFRRTGAGRCKTELVTFV